MNKATDRFVFMKPWQQMSHFKETDKGWKVDVEDER